MTPNGSAGSPLEPLKRTSLAAEAVDVLRVRIITGELELGRLYALKDIAAQLGVSPTPVRDAVLALAGQGLVVVVRNRGFHVAEMTDEDLQHVVDIRMMLEPPAVRRVAQLHPIPDLSELRRIAESMEVATSQGDSLTFLTLDKQFHLLLIGLLGNTRLTSTVEQLRDQTRLSGLARMTDEEAMQSAREHGFILDAVGRADGDLAEELMTQHLAHILGLWAGREEPTAGPRQVTSTDTRSRHA